LRARGAREIVGGARGVSMPLEDPKVNVRVKLAAAWTSVMFCYIYADYFDLYRPGKLRSMLEGLMAPLGPVTQGVLLGTSVMLVIPALMIFLSVALPPRPCRWLNVVFGVVYTAIILVTMWGWAFMVLYGVIEVVLTLLVVWYAWTWPRSTPGR
jgi:hypothetical protein